MSTKGMPHRLARAVGDFGEEHACAVLQARGWEVLDRNWRCASGEIDLVARDGDTVVFCEVKTRRSQRYGSPAEAITPAKAARLRRLAILWLRAYGGAAPHIRIDVIGVLVPRSGPCQVQHLEGVC